MKGSDRKLDSGLEHLYGRLDEIKMGEYERLMAKASLARAEAVSQLLHAAVRGLQRLLRALVVRPIRRLTSALG